MSDDAPVVVKIGGARAVDPAGAVADIATIAADGTPLIVVHGGSTAVDDLLAALGTEPEYVTTPSGVTGRFTDAETMDVVTMAMAGRVNTDLTVALRNAGANALGLSGVDGGLLTGPRKSAVRVLEDGKKKIRRGDHAGSIESVNAGLLELLVDAGYLPVVGLPMLAEDGTAVNTDADRAAAAVAGAVGGRLVILTDVAGIYRDPADPTTAFDEIDSPGDLEAVSDAAEGFMTRKVMAAEEALEAGASAVVVADANVDEPIQAALAGAGTRFTPAAIAGDSA